MSSDPDRPTFFRVWPRADVQSYEEWRREFEAFHDYHRRKFYEARARSLAARRRIRELLRERRRQ